MDPYAEAMADAAKAGDEAAALALADWLLERRAAGAEAPPAELVYVFDNGDGGIDLLTAPESLPVADVLAHLNYRDSEHEEHGVVGVVHSAVWFNMGEAVRPLSARIRSVRLCLHDEPPVSRALAVYMLPDVRAWREEVEARPPRAGAGPLLSRIDDVIARLEARL